VQLIDVNGESFGRSIGLGVRFYIPPQLKVFIQFGLGAFRR
jgi:hypothetical protein